MVAGRRRMEEVEDGNEEKNSVSRRLLCYNLKLVRNMTKIRNSQYVRFFFTMILSLFVCAAIAT